MRPVPMLVSHHDAIQPPTSALVKLFLEKFLKSSAIVDFKRKENSLALQFNAKIL